MLCLNPGVNSLNSLALHLNVSVFIVLYVVVYATYASSADQCLMLVRGWGLDRFYGGALVTQTLFHGLE